MVAEEQIRAALSYIDSTDRNTWIKMGAAVKTELGDSGFNLWDEWSQSASNYNARAAQTAWKSLKEGRVNIGTLFYEAKQRGFKPERNPQPLSKEEVKRRQEESAVKRAEHERKERELKDNAQTKAKERWFAASTAVDLMHPYLVAKGINELAAVRGLRMEGDNLLIPMKQLGEIHGLQAIDPTGQKRFNEHATLAGSSYLMGDWKKAEQDNEVIVCEGFATGASIHLATGKAVVVCFTGNNLEKVAERIAKNTDVNVVIAGDWDRSGMGAKYAMDAKQHFEEGKVTVKFPEFTPEELAQEHPPSDFNDLAKLRGLDHLKKSFDEAFRELKPELQTPAIEPSIEELNLGKAMQERGFLYAMFTNEYRKDQWSIKVTDDSYDIELANTIATPTGEHRFSLEKNPQKLLNFVDMVEKGIPDPEIGDTEFTRKTRVMNAFTKEKSDRLDALHQDVLRAQRAGDQEAVQLAERERRLIRRYIFDAEDVIQKGNIDDPATVYKLKAYGYTKTADYLQTQQAEQQLDKQASADITPENAPEKAPEQKPKEAVHESTLAQTPDQERQAQEDNNREAQAIAAELLAQSSRPTRAQIESSQQADIDIDAKFGQITGIGTIPSEAIIQANEIRGLKSLKPVQQVIVRASINNANKTLSQVDANLRGDIKRNYVENLEKAIEGNTLNIPKELEKFVEDKLAKQQTQQREAKPQERVAQQTPDLVM